MLNRKTPPALSTPDVIDVPVPEKIVLSNGIPVYIFNSGTQDVVCVELAFSAGSRYQRHAFSAFTANMLLREGTSSHTAKALAEKLDFYGAHFENSTERDNAYVALYSLNKHLSETLPLLAEIILEPVFPENELEIFTAKHRQMLLVNKEKVNYLARTAFNPIIFGENHPYGIHHEPEELDSLTRNMLVDFHSTHYHAANCKILLSGRIQSSTLDLLEKYLGGSGWRGSVFEQIPPEPEYAKQKEHFIRKNDALQSAIRMGCRIFNRCHPDFAGLKMLNTLLGGYFGSRLMSNLREDKGYTYGIGSATVPLRYSGFFVIAGEVGAKFTQAALDEIKSELLRLCTEPVTDEEFSLLRNYMWGEMVRATDGPFSQASLYRELICDELDHAWIENYWQTIQQTTPGKITELANKYFHPDELYTLVVGAG